MSSVRGQQAGLEWSEPAGGAALPTPPLRLRRVHLRGVGPDGARFDPLDLDFVTMDGAASRVLLSLTNTGGKSTLITLVSSLVVPAARAQVGGKNLGDYVLTGDTSHVVCEWEDATNGTRTVTGTVMEWKDGRRQPGHRQRSTTDMHRAWYLFRTRPGEFGIDDLPFVTDGRRTTFEAFVGKVSSLLSPRPGSQWAMTRVQQEWTRALEQRTSIDPALFGYQMRMNDSEAGAEKLLAAFDSPDNVVRFFVAALNDDRELADFTGKLRPYAELAVQRPGLEALAAFGKLVGPRIDVLHERADTAERAEREALSARLAGGEHAAAIDNRVARDRESLDELEKSALDAAREAATARREYGQISDIVLQLQLEDARARLAAATTAVEHNRSVASSAAAEARAWDAVDVVVDVEAARAERDSAQAAYDAADAGLDPLRARVGAAGAALAGRLEALAAEATTVADDADREVEAAEGAAEQAVDRRGKAGARAGDAQRDLSMIDTESAAATVARGDAVTAGWLLDGERPDLCQRRWDDAARAAEQEALDQDRIAGEAETAFDTVVADIEDLDGRLVGLRETAGQDLRDLRAFDADLIDLTADETILTILGEQPRHTAGVDRTAVTADEVATGADARAADHERLAKDAADELAHLDETGTAPAGVDVLAVLAVLIDARLGAVTGLEWIEHNIVEADARPAFIAAHPELAGGVVVTDPTRFDDAVTRLDEAEVTTRTPVAVVTTPTTRIPVDVGSTAHAGRAAADRNGDPQDPGGSPIAAHDRTRRHVVVPHRATWDRQWAAASRDRLDQLVKSEATAAATARTAAASHRRAAAACRQFVTRWPAASHDELARRSQESTDAVTAAEGRRTALRVQRDGHRSRAAAARRRRDAAREAAATARAHVRAASELAAVYARTAQAAERRAGVEKARQRAARDVEAARANEAAARATAKAALERAAQARANREPWLRERDSLGVEVAGPDPGGNLELVRRTWTSLRGELAAAEQGVIEAGLLDRAERRLGEVTGRLERHEQPVIDRARVLAGTMMASSRESLSGAQRRARQDAETAEINRVRAEAEQTAAEAAVRSAQPTERSNYLDLANFPEWLPDTPTDIPQILGRLEIRNGELLTRRDAAEQSERETRELHDLVAGDVTALADTSAMWSVDSPPTAAVFEGTKDAARTRMRELLEAHCRAEEAARQARRALRDAVTDARAVVTDARWRDLDAPVAVRLRSLRESQLVAEAAVLSRRIASMTHSALGDLETMDTHRSLIRDGLVSFCRDQRRLLREVSRSSRLPAGLGELSHQPAIKIRFTEAPEDAAIARLAARIDGWATELAAHPKRASSSDIRARWLADAVRDTVVDRVRAGAWTVEILKPRIDGKVMYCPPDRIPHEFSGGQVLTLAVLIYCTLSGVRSAHRAGGSRPPGTLILDNPFGTASAEALIEMQHRLAAHTGLQLVCATGLNDAGVDAAFTGPGSVIVKLRNDGDTRRNLSFLHLRAKVVDGVDIAAAITSGRDTDSRQNWVDASAYEIRR